MPTSPLNAPTMIAKADALTRLVEQLSHEPLIAVDTESNSLYAYRERVCLIQISTRESDFLIDPLAIKDLSPLAPLFADPQIEKVFHAAEYDIMCLKRDYGFTFANLFDTMVASRIIGRKQIGLGNLLGEYFGVEVNKRFQRADWSRRPIPRDQLNYAQHDTHYLPALRDILGELLHQQHRYQEAQEVFADLCAIPAAVHTFDPDGFWRIHAARELSPREMAVLKELFLLRDKIAQQRNYPPFKVVNDETLITVVKKMPGNEAALYTIEGLNDRLIERQGAAILEAIQRGMQSKPPQRPDLSPRLDQETTARYDTLHRWRKMRAAERGVESDVIIPKEALWALAKNPAHTLEELEHIPGLGPWKRDQYGEELLKLLANGSLADSAAVDADEDDVIDVDEEAS
ncbi:MAG: ribonuclease D [Anaerolineae bacterium]|nr:ribonuclease D [Anaerolineae bacterium]